MSTCGLVFYLDYSFCLAEFLLYKEHIIITNNLKCNIVFLCTSLAMLLTTEWSDFLWHELKEKGEGNHFLNNIARRPSIFQVKSDFFSFMSHL